MNVSIELRIRLDDVITRHEGWGSNSSGAAAFGERRPRVPIPPRRNRLGSAHVSFPPPRPGFVTIVVFALSFALGAAWQDFGPHLRSRQVTHPASGSRPSPSAPPRRPVTVLAMGPDARAAVLGERILADLVRVADVDPALLVTGFRSACSEDAVRRRLAVAEVLFTGWGCPPLDADALELMPELRAVVHAAGSVKHHVTEACWERGLLVSSAAAANALPVAEYTLAAILFANKRVLDSAHAYRAARGHVDPLRRYPAVGNYRRTVGLVGASLIGRRVLELLRPFDLRVLVHDPYADPAELAALGAEAVALDELLTRSDVVSLHAPELPRTRRMLDAPRLALMPDGATLVNTARGSLVDTAALTEELVSGRLHAVLDHTEPEVLPADSPLYDLPNVLLTPHVAGALGGELDRLAASAVEELGRYAQGFAFRHPVDRARLGYSA